MTEILFSGCSYTKGIGLDLEDADPANACNVFARESFKNDYNVTNIAQGGNSNLNIYLSANLALLSKQYDYAFVCWTSYPRYNFAIGFDTYQFMRPIMFAGMPLDDSSFYNGHSLSYSKKWLNKFKDMYFLAHHDHYEVINIMKYMTMLSMVADRTNTNLYFINNLCKWDQDFFLRQHNFLPGQLTPQTQKLLDVSTRSDEEIAELYSLMHNDFEANGGIKEHRWLNLYTPFRNPAQVAREQANLDYGNDNWHPGPLSHMNFGMHLAQCFSDLQHTSTGA
jgi:hypothetical protein